MYDFIISAILILIGIAVIYGLCFVIAELISTSIYYIRWHAASRRFNRQKSE